MTHTVETAFCYTSISTETMAQISQPATKLGGGGTIARTLDLFAYGEAADWLQTSRVDLAARMTRAQIAG